MPYFEHGDSLYAHAEGEARIYVGIHAAIFEDAAIDHARAEHLYPTRALAQPTALSAAFEQLKSTSTLGSVKGKYEGRSRTFVELANIFFANSASMPCKSQRVIPLSTTSPSI